jgi:IPT/TIG domain-containing protein
MNEPEAVEGGKEMATELKKVQPGELIKSDLMNLIIEKLLALDTGTQPTGSVTVPNLFGRTLSEAATVIKQPQISLQLSNVVDAFGAPLDPDLTENKSRLILNQVPEPGARVNPGSLIDLLVAAKPSTSTTGTSLKPTINTVNPFNPAKVPIGQDVTINGNNFALDRTKNRVTFDGVAAVGDPTPESSKNKLVVKVPAISAAPAEGQEKEVTVVVTTPDGGASDGVKLVVLPPLAGANPTITSIQSSDVDFARVGEVIIINGSGFSSTLTQNQVTFDTVNTFPEQTGNTPEKITVKVPAIAGVVGPADFKDISIFVTVNGRKSNVKGPFTIGGKIP